MGRRKGGSSAGMGLLIVIGLVFAALNAAYQFVLDHLAEIKVAVTVSGLLLIAAYFVSKLGGRKHDRDVSDERLDAAVRAEPSMGFIASEARPARHKDEPRRNVRWVSRRETVDIQGSTVSGGMFYLGTGLRFAGRTIDQYTLDPALPVRAARPDTLGTSMPYWPSYADIPAASRRAFLDWMARGRSDRTYGIGHVFLYFYGLEHRMFAEGAIGDAAELIAEVERLRAIYGENDSFREYSDHFLDAARLAHGALPAPPEPSPERPYRSEMPLDVRLHLGRRLSQSTTLLSEDSLLWILSLPDVYLRTPAVRCFPEFTALWHIRFRRHFPDGFPVMPGDRLEIAYSAASRAFEVVVDGAYRSYADPLKIGTSLEPLRQLVQECTEELEGFSRLLGRRPEARASAQAALLLPEDLLAEGGFEALRIFGDRLAEMMGGRNQASTQMGQLLELAAFDVAETGKITPGIADQLGRILDRLDVAIEPDRRYGGSIPQLEDQVFLFGAPGGGPVDPQDAPYRSMKARVEVAVLAAAADGEATGEEIQRVIAGIKADSALSGVQKARLIAFAVITFNSPPKQARLLKRLAEHSEPERQAIAAAAVAIVGANDKVDPQEVRFLEKLHKALDLPQEQVYLGLHRVESEVADGPVAISSEHRIAGIPLPSEQPPPAPRQVPGVRIDADRLARTRRETAEVSRLLADIFEEETGETSEPATTMTEPSAFEGLDRPHTELVEMLELKGSTSRAEFEERARAMKLLPDGAIERINDWAFDRFDEALLDEGEEIAIVPHLLGRLGELRETA